MKSDNNVSVSELVTGKEYKADWSTGPVIYTEYTDKAQEGVFTSVYDGHQMLEQDWWREGQPNDSGGDQNCAVMDIGTGKLWDDPCNDNYCSACQIKKSSKYQLRGFLQGQ